MPSFDLITVVVALTAFGFVPVVIMASTCFLKIVVVMSLLRNALGVQQTPPNLALYGMGLILTVYVMNPAWSSFYNRIATDENSMKSLPAFMTALSEGAEPVREFMLKNSRQAQRDFFMRTSKRVWGEELSRDVQQRDFVILTPAFIVSELTSAFEIGFLIYIPFLIIDLIISNILLALGMMMVSPITISLPLKIFLFVVVDGWTRLIHGLILTYHL